MEPQTDETLDVLIVEDNPGDARLIEHHLESESNTVFDPPELTRVESLSAAFDALEANEYDLVLLDLGLPGTKGIETLKTMNEFLDEHAGIDPVPVVVLTGLSDHGVAIEAIEAGAQDYLVKGNIDGETLGRAIRYALERHEQEQELKRQNERLERFASVVSHDLRNPLNAAQTMAEVLVDRTDESDEHHDKYGHIFRSCQRMEDIIEDVLSLARRGQSVDETAPVSLPELTTESWETVDTAEATLAIESEATIEADRSRLRQLLENLFRNSFEHGPADVTITIGDTDGGFFVADNGPGIPPEDREEVFEMGYTTNHEGTGFGLNIVEEIAEAHGWTVTVGESESGGARFDIRGVTRP